MSSGKELLRKSVKHGIGRLTASADSFVTHLTQVAHKAPTRLIPVRKSSVRSAGAAVCALSNYGAGMLQGDSAELSVAVEAGAKLGLVTQGAARIYTQKVPGEVRASMDVRVEKAGVLVFTPDPCAMFASSSYRQIQRFEIHPDSSVALIDWFSSGRFKNQERWEFDTLTTRTSLRWMAEERTTSSEEQSTSTDDDIPFLQDSICIDLQEFNDDDDHHAQDSDGGRDAHGVADFNCFASLILYGNEMEAVKQKCQILSDSFAAQHTRIRQRSDDDKTPKRRNIGELNLAERVVMGISRVPLPGKPRDAYVVRLAGKTNEDIYRVFHDCLLPLAPSFGFEFYKDRIMAQRSEILAQEGVPPTSKRKVRQQQVNGANSKALLEESSVPQKSSAFWSVVMLADSGLPTGSFAHSAGLEAAAQLRMIRGEDDVRNFIQAATRSSIQLLAPFLIGGLRIAQQQGEEENTAWETLHRQCHAVMVTNEPACSASLDQGKSLVRVASHWLVGNNNCAPVLNSLKAGPNPHIAPALGMIGGLLGLDEIQVCRLFAYCMARDLVSSAVRLSLVGPLASVPLLDSVQDSTEEGIRSIYDKMSTSDQDPLLVAATSAPVIEAIHPCHEILQVRLFRS